MSDHLVDFAIGAIGGALKEFMRWRALVLKGRAKQYLKPQWLGATLGFIFFAGVVGALFGAVGKVIFGSGVRPLSLIVAFTAGVGLEEIVRLAAQLKIWLVRLPNVRLGDRNALNVRLGDDMVELALVPDGGVSTDTGPSLLEFLER